MKQGDIFLINLAPAIHSEIGKTRPGVILSVNAMNLHSPKLIIAPITSSVGKIYPFEIFITGGQSAACGLDKDSKIMLDQMRSVDKRRLTKRIGLVEHEILSKACAIAQKLINAPSAAKE